MKAVIKRVGKNPVKKEIGDDIAAGLHDLQSIVGGLIEAVPYEDFLLICNEEGKLQGLAPNFFHGNDLIVGDVAFIGKDGESFVSLTLAQQNLLLAKFTAERG